MGALKSNNDRIRLSNAHNWDDTNPLYETDMTKTLVIENQTCHQEETYKSINSVPIKKVSLLSSFLESLIESNEEKVKEDRLMAFKKNRDDIQNRECPVCKSSEPEGWVIIFNSSPAFFVHDDCIDEMVEIESDLMENPEEYIHELI